MVALAYSLKYLSTHLRHNLNNPYAEKLTKSIKDECSRNLVFLSEVMIREAVSEYKIYCNAERPRQNLNNEFISSRIIKQFR